MNWTDYFIAGVVVVSVLIGLWRGLVAEVLALAIWIGSIWCAWAFGPTVAGYFDHSIQTPELRLAAGYGVCVVAVLIVGALIKAIFRRLVVGSGLSAPDRMLGLVFGFARGVLLVALMVFLLSLTPVTREPWWRQSVLLPQFQSVAIAVGQHLPASTARFLHPVTPAPQAPSSPAAAPPQNASAGLPASLPASLPAVRQLLDRAGTGGRDVLGDLGAALHPAAPAPTSTAPRPSSPTADPAAVP